MCHRFSALGTSFAIYLFFVNSLYRSLFSNDFYLHLFKAYVWHHNKAINEIVLHDAEEFNKTTSHQLNFSSHTLQEASEFVEQCCAKCIEDKIVLLIASVKLFDFEGNLHKINRF